MGLTLTLTRVEVRGDLGVIGQLRLARSVLLLKQSLLAHLVGGRVGVRGWN